MGMMAESFARSVRIEVITLAVLVVLADALHRRRPPTVAGDMQVPGAT